MYCIHCGALLADEAQLCSKCGRPVNAIPSMPASSPGSAQVKKPISGWRYLVYLILFGLYATVFFPQYDLETIPAVFWGPAAICYYLWKRSGRRGLEGFFVGLPIGIFSLLAVGFISTSVLHSIGG